MTDKISRAIILHVNVIHARLMDKGSLGGRHQLIKLGRDDGHDGARLHNGQSVVESLDGSAASDQVRAGLAPKGPEDVLDAPLGAQQLGEAVQASEGGAVRWGGDGDKGVDNVVDAAELGGVEGLECAFGVPDEVDFAGARGLVDGADEGGDLRRRLADGLEAADEGEAVVGAVGEGECAEAFCAQPGLELVEVLVGGGAEAVEEHDWVVAGFAGEVVVGGG